MDKRVVSVWLLIGVIMVFIQIVIGGVTRLTGSGLSITSWEIVTGTLPPLDEEAWNDAFEKYKQTPQYRKINRGMTMSDFKFIYFWEYFHRLWARLMGFVFLIPFVWFSIKKWITKELGRRLIVVFILASIVAGFGWIMVASGLVDRPWVNAYKLSMHLGLGVLLFGYLFWTFLHSYFGREAKYAMHGYLLWILVFFAMQILLGGLMSGMKAGLYYPTWPDMHGQWIPAVILDPGEWRWQNLISYDTNAFAPAIVQFLHRLIAYVITVLMLLFGVKYLRQQRKVRQVFSTGIILAILIICLQVTIGIITVLECVGGIPVFWGVLHQAGAMVLLLCILYLAYLSKTGLWIESMAESEIYREKSLD